MNDLELLRTRFAEQQKLYLACAAQARELWWVSRLLVQAWLAEIELMIAQLERRVVQLGSAASPIGMDAAWQRYYDVLTALSPAAPAPASERVDVRAVGWRLLVVIAFLLFQIALAIFLVSAAVDRFKNFDPQSALTREQLEERAQASAEINRVRFDLERAAADLTRATAAAAAPPAGAPAPPPTPGAAPAPAAPAPPDLSVVRAEVESLVSTLTDMRLADRDLRLANLRIDSVLAGLDKEPPDYAGGAAVLSELASAFRPNPQDVPPDPMSLILLGSLLGMITITIQLNWKFRNRWDTIGFLPWYLTRLVAAPVISWAAMGLMFQVSFTADLSATGGNVGTLGLRGASPLLIFAIAILTGLFSNLIFDWLRSRINATAAGTRQAQPTTKTTPPPEGQEPAE
jgi:hypothetical protein